MKIKNIDDEKIKFDNGIILKYYHNQDCCEEVYADFEVLKTYNVSTKTGKTISIYDIDFEEDYKNLIEFVEDIGFMLTSKIGEKFLVNCYNQQNGYYNSRLDLILINGNVEIKIDISQCVKDDIRE